MIKHAFSVVFLAGLAVISLIGCKPGTPPGDTFLSDQTPITKPVITKESPENKTTGESPRQPSPEAASTASLELDVKSNANADLARQDLAQRLGISVADIAIVAVIGQEFSTDAFYCKTTKEQERIARDEPLQALSGFDILLSAGGRQYEYHASGQMVIFCRPLN